MRNSYLLAALAGLSMAPPAAGYGPPPAFGAAAPGFDPLKFHLAPGFHYPQAGRPQLPAAVMQQIHPAVLAAMMQQPQPQAQYARGSGSLQFGIDSGTTIAAAGSATLIINPQKSCVPLTFIVGPTVADGFAILDVKVGVDTLLATTGAMSAAGFVANTTAPYFIRKLLEVGTDFIVQVQNVTASTALRFLATGIAERHGSDACV